MKYAKGVWGSNQPAHLCVAEALKRTAGMHQESKTTFWAMAVFRLQVRTWYLLFSSCPQSLLAHSPGSKMVFKTLPAQPKHSLRNYRPEEHQNMFGGHKLSPLGLLTLLTGEIQCSCTLNHPVRFIQATSKHSWFGLCSFLPCLFVFP